MTAGQSTGWPATPAGNPRTASSSQVSLQDGSRLRIGNPGPPFRDAFRARQAPAGALGGPIWPAATGGIDDLVVVGQIGQSLDGRIATAPAIPTTSTGRPGSPTCTGCAPWSTRWWSGSAPRWPTIRRLTVRRVDGPAAGAGGDRPRRPAAARRQAVGRRRRAPAGDHGGGARAVAAGRRRGCRLPAADGQIAPAAILAALAERGFRRMLIEGGADTVSRFLAARLPRPAARGGGADHPRLRAVPSSRCRRSRAPTRRCARRCVCISSATRCCSTAICRLSACRSAARTDRHDRRGLTSGRPRSGRAGASASDRCRPAAGRRSRAPRRPSRRASPVWIARSSGPNDPIGCAVRDRVADALETAIAAAPPPARARGRNPCRGADAH